MGRVVFCSLAAATTQPLSPLRRRRDVQHPILLILFLLQRHVTLHDPRKLHPHHAIQRHVHIARVLIEQLVPDPSPRHPNLDFFHLGGRLEPRLVVGGFLLHESPPGADALLCGIRVDGEFPRFVGLGGVGEEFEEAGFLGGEAQLHLGGRRFSGGGIIIGSEGIGARGRFGDRFDCRVDGSILDAPARTVETRFDIAIGVT
mmetsp:Transcript_12584/g.27205  ORF Transcript_12584/g.27205 Transcript_12584/m.27205 type:complete len:202 (+) Transcript_12584:1746-2351(+)